MVGWGMRRLSIDFIPKRFGVNITSPVDWSIFMLPNIERKDATGCLIIFFCAYWKETVFPWTGWYLLSMEQMHTLKNCLLCLWIWQFSFITNDFLPLIKYIFVGIDMCEYIYQINSLLCYELVTDFQCRNFHSWWDSTMAQCLHNYVYSDCNQCFQFSESEQIYDSTFLVYGFCFHYYWGSNIYVYMSFSGFVYE